MDLNKKPVTLLRALRRVRRMRRERDAPRRTGATFIQGSHQRHRRRRRRMTSGGTFALIRRGNDTAPSNYPDMEAVIHRVSIKRRRLLHCVVCSTPPPLPAPLWWNIGGGGASKAGEGLERFHPIMTGRRAAAAPESRTAASPLWPATHNAPRCLHLLSVDP